MKSTQLITLCVLAISTSYAFGQTKSDAGSEKYKHSIGASLFMLYNFFPESADYYLLTYGYQFS